VPRFIELMPMSGGRLFVPGELLAAQEIRAAVAEAAGGPLVADAGRGSRGSVRRPTGGSRRAARGAALGVIAPMTENFCAGCNRLRISASGQLHNCLARDDTGDLRSVLRGRGLRTPTSSRPGFASFSGINRSATGSRSMAAAGRKSR
jgi:cyclic pyranopterin phosphate synthase